MSRFLDALDNADGPEEEEINPLVDYSFYGMWFGGPPEPEPWSCPSCRQPVPPTVHLGADGSYTCEQP